MGKSKFLKTSYIKRKIKEGIIKSCLLDYKIFKRNTKSKNILIITLDALGDNVVKNKTIELLCKDYSNENIFILCKSKWKSIYELQGYKNIFVDETKWNIFYKIKMYRRLNNIGFEKVIILNHSHYPDEADFIINESKYSMVDEAEYILDKHTKLLKEVYGRDFSLEEVKPDLRRFFPTKKYGDIIGIAIGASNNMRTLPVKKMGEIVNYLKERYPNKKIAILGSGKKQQKYYEEMVSLIGSENLENYIDRIPLIETIQIINDSDFFIGYDSGLLNIAFTLKKPSICLHWSKEKYIWEHPESFIKTLKGIDKREFENKKYGTAVLNSIEISQVEKALDELEK